MRSVDHDQWLPQVGIRSSTAFENQSGEEWLVLFAEIADGNEKALDRLFEVSARKVYGLALWRTASVEDARDVVQEVFVRIAERRHDLLAVRDPRSWLMAVAHRLAVDLCRRRTVRRTVPLDEVVLFTVASGDAERTIDQGIATRLLLQLPAAQRDVIYLHLFAGLTFAAVGDVVGVPTFTAASRYRLGVGKLRRLMEGVS